jgi:outer membrane protein
MNNCSRYVKSLGDIPWRSNRKTGFHQHAVRNAVKATISLLVITSATTSGASSLERLASEALAADAGFRSAEAAWRAGIEKSPQARAGLLPQIGIQQVIYRNGIRIPGQTVPGYSTNGFTLTLNQPLFNWTAWESWQQGQLLALDADLMLAQARQDLLLRVAQAYLAAVNAKDDLVLAIGHRKAVAEQLALAKRRFALGDATIVDTNEALAGLDSARADEVAAHTQLDTSYAALEKTVGHPVNQVSEWRDDVRLPPVEPASLEQWMDAAATGDYGVRRRSRSNWPNAN